MNKNNDIGKLIDEALNSVDDIQRATPKPYLLTRINARMSNVTASIWEKAGWFITRPAVAFTGLCLIVLVNVMVMVKTDPGTAGNGADQVAYSSTDDFSTVATIYDLENTQP